ncbi:hypothetical protein STCU_11088 [Strigomonas culicis]|uniref:non-specific serine/threonine protein kinase n=1 Tax=Strigomonas culicis TaxID=28005 RepID=S9TIF2_9TRYP|nr:hypothetical protein STCU_11088 [Strigomonas culicis]|eukprot:EPY16639.1 hypothetical protein STCU_11088 [Strigomonas culicis]
MAEITAESPTTSGASPVAPTNGAAAHSPDGASSAKKEKAVTQTHVDVMDAPEQHRYARANVDRPREYWDYDSLRVQWNSPDQYEVEAKIGRGKYSDVFLGVDTKVNRKVVVKVLKPVKKKKSLESCVCCRSSRAARTLWSSTTWCASRAARHPPLSSSTWRPPTSASSSLRCATRRCGTICTRSSSPSSTRTRTASCTAM